MKNRWRIVLITLAVGMFTIINGAAIAQDNAERKVMESGIKPQEIFQKSILGLAEKLASFSGSPQDLFSFFAQIQKVRSELTFSANGVSAQTFDRQAIDFNKMDSTGIGELVGLTGGVDHRAETLKARNDVDSEENLLLLIITPTNKRPEAFLGFGKVEEFDDYANKSILNLLSGLTPEIEGKAVQARPIGAFIQQDRTQEFIEERIDADSDIKD